MKTAKGYPLKEEKVNVIAELEAKIEHFLENPDDKESFYYTSQTSGNVKEEIGGLTSAIHTQKKVIKTAPKQSSCTECGKKHDSHSRECTWNSRVSLSFFLLRAVLKELHPAFAG